MALTETSAQAVQRRRAERARCADRRCPDERRRRVPAGALGGLPQRRAPVYFRHLPRDVRPNDQIDPYTVRAACGTEYIELVKDLCGMMMTPSNCAAYVRQLRDCSIRYRLDALLHETRSHIAYAAPLPEVAALVERMQTVLASGSEDRGSDMNALLAGLLFADGRAAEVPRLGLPVGHASAGNRAEPRTVCHSVRRAVGRQNRVCTVGCRGAGAAGARDVLHARDGQAPSDAAHHGANRAGRSGTYQSAAVHRPRAGGAGTRQGQSC